MIDFGVDTLDQPAPWQDIYHKIPPNKRSPYFSPGFYKAYMDVELHPVECFRAYQDDENFLIYPYLKKSINALGYDLLEEYHDISGAYGYGGPIGMATDIMFISQFNDALQHHLLNSKIVSEFVRYCPITDNRRYHTYIRQFDMLDNVFIDLSQGVDYVWNESFEYRVRKTVRKGDSYHLSTTVRTGMEVTENDLNTFYRIYTSTMERNAADEFYYFDLLFFVALLQNLGDNFLLATTWLGDTAITTELVLLGGTLAFGFLGGTLADYYSYKANTYQRWELIKHLCRNGFTTYSLGGGAQRGDNIYKFKMSFAQDCIDPFFIGTKVHLPDVYNDITQQWSAKYPNSAMKHAGKLQGYRILH